jgi:hypothetical protein
VYNGNTKQYAKLEENYRTDISSQDLQEELVKRLGEKNVVIK